MTKIVNNIFDDLLEEPKWYESIYYALLRKVDVVKYFLRNIYERIRYGFPLHQSWDFKTWHAEIVVPRLKYLRLGLMGHPCDITFEEWQSILDKMIWSFEHLNDDVPIKYSEDYDHRYQVTYENGYKTYTSLNKTGTIDTSERDAHYDKLQDGFNLFGKHYQSLWD